jgi:16S rRNA (cytosine967-C5)-methyltransferase
MPRVILACGEEEASRVRPLVLAAYDEARHGRWPFLSDVLERSLRGVGDEERGVASAAVRALVKYDRLVAFGCGTDEAGARFDALLSMAHGSPSEVDLRIARIESPVERLGVAFSFPDWIVDLVRNDSGDSALESVLARMNEPAPRVARVNALRATRETCLGALSGEGVAARPTAHAQRGIVLDGRRSPFRTKAFARGEFEMQDEASQLVAEVVAPPPRSLVVDACAGAGGKTLALAASLGGKGHVVGLDCALDRLEELRRRARRAGASNVQSIAVDLLDPGDALRFLEGRAARVLVDAPCTGLGAIRRNPEARWRLRPEQLASLREAQTKLLSAAATLVAPRGRLVYATCSFLRREGEDIVERFLADQGSFSPVTVRDVLGRARTQAIATVDGRYLRTWRFDGSVDGGDEGMDGFFGAVMRLREGAC